MPRVTITSSHHASAGAVDDVAITRLSSKFVITAVRTSTGDLKVIVWEVGSDGSLTRRGDASAGPASQLAITDWPEGPGVVTAVRTAGGTLKVIAWTVDASGGVQRRGDAEAGAVKEVAISSPSGFVGVVTPVVNASGRLEVIAWKLSATGTLTRGGTGTGGTCTGVTVTALSKTAAGARFATACRTEGGDLKVITWTISTTPASTITRLGEASAGPVTEIALTARATPNADLVTATRGADGNLAVIGWSVGDDGGLARVSKATGGGASDIAVSTWKPDVHTYVVGAMRTDSGDLKVIVWRNGADLVRHGELSGAGASKVVMTGWGGGVVTANRDGAGNLRLDSWALQPAGMKLLTAEWPPTAAVATAPAPPAQLADPLGKLGPGALRSYGEPPPIPQPARGGDGHG